LPAILKIHTQEKSAAMVTDEKPDLDLISGEEGQLEVKLDVWMLHETFPQAAACEHSRLSRIMCTGCRRRKLSRGKRPPGLARREQASELRNDHQIGAGPWSPEITASGNN
jgi:hypothetical protein